MHLLYRIATTILIALTLTIPAAAQTPETGSGPCAAHREGTPIPAASPTGVSGDRPDVSSDDAVLAALAIRQQHVVTIFEIVLEIEAGELVPFASERVDDARALLDRIQADAADPHDAQPAVVVGELDRLRQEQDLPADQGGLDVWLPTWPQARLCSGDDDFDRQVARMIRANDEALIEIAGIGRIVVDDPEITSLLDDVLAAAEERTAWLDARDTPAATPVATPAP